MSQSQKDSDVPLGQDPTEDSHGTPPNPDLVDDEDMNSAEEEETETEGVEPEHGEPSDDELADREERPCSVGAEQAAQRDFGELCAEDLKPKKIDFGDYIDADQMKRKVHFKKLSLDRNIVCAFLLRICMNT